MNEFNPGYAMDSTLAPIYPGEPLAITTWPYFVILGGLLLLTGMLAGWWMHRRRHATHATDRSQTIEAFKTLDFQARPSEALYRFTRLVQQLPEEQIPDGTPELLRALEAYKYTPHPPPLPSSLIRRLHACIGRIVS